jgi:hypothetical protein
MSLLYIGQQITIYTNFFLIILGVVGNGINVLVFSSVRSYRRTPCTFYFLIASIYNIGQILIILPSRIVVAGYGIDLTRTSTSWCKIRPFIIVTISLTSLTYSCLATIDQFFATSQRANVRRLSSIKWAHRIAFIVAIVWFLHGISILIFYDISPVTKSCIDTNYAYSIYYSIYILGLLCVIPCFVMITFGYLTYRNIHLTRVLAQQQADRQLIRMTLVQIVLVLISFASFGINNAYSLITAGISKSADRVINESFASTIINVMTYIYFAVCLFVFLKDL